MSTTPQSDEKGGLRWGDDLERDCAELRRLESWGLYPHGHHDKNCPLDHEHPTPPGGEVSR